MQGFLVSTAEIRERFAVVQDTIPELDGGPLYVKAAKVAIETIEPLGFPVKASCARIFRAERKLVAYVDSNCKNRGGVADGDAIVLMTASGDSVLSTILSPGGIEIVPD
jgi:hypothetical protein